MGRTDLRRLIAPLAIALAFAVPACSTGGDTADEEPYEAPDISGLWYGWVTGVDVFGLVAPVRGGDELTYRARLVMGDGGQYVTPVEGVYTGFPFDADPITLYPGTTVFTCDLVEYGWGGAGTSYGAAVSRKLRATGFMPLAGDIRIYDANDNLVQGTSGTMWLGKTSSSEREPSIEDIAGRWVIEDCWAAGNDLTLTVTPNAVNSLRGDVSGRDTRGNAFTGSLSIITGEESVNIYEVELTLNGTIRLDGLASLYVGQDDQGAEVRFLVLGASSADFGRMAGGWAFPE